MSNNPSFRPVRLTETLLNRIRQTQDHDGYLYFTTDTQKVYMGMPNGELLSMGGNTGIFYGNKEIEYPNDGNEPNPEVIFFLDLENEDNSEIEGNRLPQVDDLILNIDGCFYRVIDILDETSVQTNRITLQGTGTPGEGGGGEGSATLRISAPSGTNKIYSSGTETIVIDIVAFSSDPNNYISIVECSFDKNFNDNFLTYNLTHPLEKTYEIDLISQKNKFSEISKKVYVRVTDRYGVSRSLSYSITLAKLELSQLEDAILQITGPSLIYSCNIGGSSGISNRQLEYRFYDLDGIEIPEYTQFYELEANQFNQIQKSIDASKIIHGSYELRVSLTGMIGNTLITSNILSHKVIRYDNDIAQPIFAYLLPNKFEQYTDIVINYMLAYGDSQKKYTMNILVNEEDFSSQIITTGQIEQYIFNFDKSGSYKIEMKIPELNIDEDFIINVEKYTGILPIINIDRDDLKVYLTAKGRTNSVADKDHWPDYKNPTMKASLSNFYYRNVNGWMVDNKGVNYLKVTQGASVEFKDFSPYAVSPTTRGLTIELDFMVDGILDYEQNLIECLSLHADNSIKTGFVVKGDTFKYYASGNELVSLNLVEGKRIKLSFVIEPKNIKYPMCYTYLDGIISKVVNYDDTYDFTNNPENPGYLKINSTGGQVYIYNIRFYSSALEEPIVLNNYQATLDTLDARQFSYEQNLIRDLYGNINLAAIESEEYNLQIPYVKITGGYQADKTFTMAKKASNNVPSLPVGKKDYRSIDIEIIYPKEHQNAYFKDYKDFKITTTFDDPALNVLNGFEKTPVEGAMMYAQGTSSLEYPVKNLRVQAKGKKFTVRPDIAPVELVTFKADFMESAGAHNTGAANYIDDLYDSIGIETPGQSHFKDKNIGTIVTCIKGHPCVIFWNPGIDENGNELSRDSKNYHFIGKYNLNLDKATPEPFGFMNDKEDESFGYEIKENGEKVNSIYCFEFLDNNEKVCNFIHDTESTYIDYDVNDSEDKIYELNNKTEQERYFDSWYSKRINEDGEIVHGWMRGFESRYPEDKEDLHDADALFSLASWINNLYAIRYIDGKETEAIQKFRDEYQGYLDKEFLLAYYLITEVLLMADNRVKNMMIATWGKENREWKTDSGESRSSDGYIWYPIFYDMDTMLGLDNIGYVNKNYYDEDTKADVFNGDEILWEFVRDGLKNELAQEYNKIEQSGAKSFTKAAIIPYFNENQATLANETFYNEDAFYKYIDTFRNGYYDHLHDKFIPEGTGSRLYAAQGNRAMMREFFIDNRIRYLRGKYLSTNYQEGDRIEFRLTYPKYKEVPDLPDDQLDQTQKEQKLINASIAAVPPSGEFEYTSMKIGYAGVKVGTSIKNYRFSEKQTRVLDIDTSSGNGTETYLFGISNLSDVGDLSDKYLYKLIVGGSENNLKQLILGNHNKDYYNPYWSNETSIELKGFTFLEKFSLENCNTFKGSVNFTESPQIKTILLNGSNTSALTLPVGGVLEELRLPTSLTNLYIDSHPELTNDKFTLGYFDYDMGVYVNDFSKLVHVALIGVPQIDSYSLIRSILFGASNRLETYCFQDINWVITDSDDLEFDENGYVTGIKVLDILLGSSKAAYEGYTKAEALIGTLTIDIPNIKINEFDIYQTYQFSCPNLKIKYSEDVDLIAASEINFYNTDIIAEATRPYYSVLSNNEYDLDYLTSSIGPSGSKLPEPQKLATNDKTFTFSGNWIVYKSEDNDIEVNSKINQANFKQIVPKGNLDLIPEFISSERLYSVVLYDYDETPLIETLLPYNTDIGIALIDNYHSYYNYRPYDGNREHYRYEFKGWQSEYDFNNKTNNITYSTLKGKLVQGKLKLYAFYQEEDCLTTPSNSDYFIFLNDTLSIKEEYKNILQGKITFPSKNENGIYMKKINTRIMTGNKDVTHIYFLDNAQYTTILEYAFYNCSNLEQVINLPNSITEIGQVSFQLCSKLQLSTLPTSLQNIGVGAFALCPNLTIEILPENLLKIERQAFLNCTNLNIKEFGTQNSAPNLSEVKTLAFQNAGKNINGDIILGKILSDGESYLVIEDGAFDKYGGNINTVYIKDSVKANINNLGFEAENIDQGGL